MNNENQLFNLTSFLFGNVDESGQLEDDILDEDCKKHLNSLCKLGLQPLLFEVIGKEDINSEETNVTSYDDNFGFSCCTKSPSAVDFFEENELAVEESVKESSDNIVEIQSGINGTQENSAPPPLVPFSKPGSVSLEPMGNQGPKKLETPLAAMLPEKYANVDVREFFPDFRFGKVNDFVSFSINYAVTQIVLIFITS